MTARTKPPISMEKEFIIRPLSKAIGATIKGLNLSNINPAQIRFVSEAFLKHQVLFFENQSLDPKKLFELASKFGKPVEYPFITNKTQIPEVMEVIKRPGDKENFGGLWHSDTSYLKTPSMGALLYAVETPEVGGDTVFSNMYKVFDSLSEEMQTFLSRLSALNISDKANGLDIRPKSNSTSFKASHPVIRTHPETKKKLIYVNEAHTLNFVGMTQTESEPLLDFLFKKIKEEQFSCRFKWEPGCVAFWDNRACQHFPVNDYQGYQRKMLRISLAGCEPF